MMQVVMWLNQNFLLVDEYHSESSLDVSFLCLRSLPKMQMLAIKMDHSGEVTGENLFYLFFLLFCLCVVIINSCLVCTSG